MIHKLHFSIIIFLISVVIITSFAQTGAKYLVITHDNFIETIRPLVEWKTKKGVPAVCVPLSQTGHTPDSIKSYIQNAYNNWNPAPDYILLVGSPNLLPAYSNNYDDYYADMTGNYQIELCIGRFHCQTLAQCSLMVAKSIGYEKSETMHDSIWFIKGTTIVREDIPPDAYYQADCRFIRNLWLNSGYYTHVDSFLSTQGHNQDSVINAIDNGRAFVVFRGQSVSYWWSPFNVNPNNTNNGYKLPIIISGTCATMTLTPGENMLGDAFVRAGTVQNPKGAVGFFGTTVVGSNISRYRGAVTRGFFQALYQDSIFTLGGAAKRGKFIMDSLYPNQTRYREWNLLGDPELNVWTSKPQELTVNHDTIIFLQPTGYRVLVSCRGAPVCSALVCAMMDSTVYTFGYTNNTGLVTLSFTPQHIGTLQITVTAHNYFPYEGTANVISNDVGITQINTPSGTIDSVGPIIPRARVKNYGTTTETFNVTFKIGTSYTQTQPKTLDAGIEDTVNFAAWIPVRGTYTIRCSTYLIGDANPNNDTFSDSCTIRVQDAGVFEIIAPTGLIDSGVTVEPQAKVKNFGTNQAAFPVIFRIGMFYADTQNVNLNSEDSTVVSFDSCALVLEGTHLIKCSTAFVDDDNPANNALRDSVTIIAPIHDDVGVTQIIAPTGIITSGMIVKPAARIANFSINEQTFPVYFRIISASDTVYYGDTLITIEANSDSVIWFDSWNSISGSYRALVRTALTGDQNPINDTALNYFIVSEAAWQRMADVPMTPSGKPSKNGTCLAPLNGKIYLLKANKTSDFYEFTPNSTVGTWVTLDAIPLGTKETGDGKDPKKGAAMTAYNSTVYVLRGNNRPGFWSYTINESPGWQKLKDIPTNAKNPKDGSGLVYVNKNGEDCIFAMKGSKTSEFYFYFIDQDNWQQVASPVTGASGKIGYKKGSCLAYDNDSVVYVLKGNYGDFFRYNIFTNTWTELKRMDPKVFLNRDGKKKKVKDGAGLAYLYGSIYLMKGGNTNELWKYDIGANNWSQMNPVDIWDIPTGEGKKVKSGGALCVLDNFFYAVKGNKTCEFYRHGPPASSLAMNSNPTISEGSMENCLRRPKAQLSTASISSIIPNPANNVATVKYNLPTSGSVSTKLYRVSGELVKSYIHSNINKNGAITIDARILPSGVYILHLESGNIKITKKLVLEK